MLNGGVGARVANREIVIGIVPLIVSQAAPGTGFLLGRYSLWSIQCQQGNIILLYSNSISEAAE